MTNLLSLILQHACGHQGTLGQDTQQPAAREQTSLGKPLDALHLDDEHTAQRLPQLVALSPGSAYAQYGRAHEQLLTAVFPETGHDGLPQFQL